MILADTLLFKNTFTIKSALIKKIKLASTLTQRLSKMHLLAALLTPNSLPHSSSSEITLVVAKFIPEEASVIPNI